MQFSVKGIVNLFDGLKGTGGLARAWVVAFNGNPPSLARDDIYIQHPLLAESKLFSENVVT